MRSLTAANQLTILRMLIIPAFVIVMLYDHHGWALALFVTAGLTDALDAPARARWPLDPDAPAAPGAGVKA